MTFMDTQERLMTRAEVAELFRVNPRTVMRWERAGRLGNVNPGGRARYAESQVWALLAGRRADREEEL